MTVKNCPPLFLGHQIHLKKVIIHRHLLSLSMSQPVTKLRVHNLLIKHSREESRWTKKILYGTIAYNFLITVQNWPNSSANDDAPTSTTTVQFGA